jgi:hypothetical protein
MSNLMARMKKASVIERASVMSKSEFFKNNDLIPLPVPMMNVAYSGMLDGGFGPGMHLVAGPSKHFKSNVCLVLVKAFLDKYEDGIILFYDSEFGAVPDYWEHNGIDVDRVIHLPIMNMEEFKFDVMKKLEEIGEGDRVMIFVDSLGNLASKKELEDALKESSAADMTRAKVGKGLSRMITPYLTAKKIPFVAVQHTYDTMELYSKKIVSGGQGWVLSSHSIFIMGKRQVKDGSELQGFEFVLNADKSRYIKEKSAIPITVTFEGGVNKFSGLLDVAVATGHVVRPNTRSYVRPFVLDESGEPETRLWKKTELNTDEFWNPILNDQSFKDAVKAMYSLGTAKTLVIDEKTGAATIANPEDDVDFDPETGEILE